ncbi:MAG TPA: 4Fe-4S binding protein [Candidatus Lokiarchaeia archaeon]|nr:4Fe-4S binding protein [Candidatus Lokiarchaeia archaeon]
MSDANCVPSVIIDPRYCKGCGLCVAVCPYSVLEMSSKLTEKGYNIAEVHQPEACVRCHKCVLICPDLAIDVVDKNDSQPSDSTDQAPQEVAEE